MSSQAGQTETPFLTIRLTKRPDKRPLLTCVRRDGSTTMAEIAPGPVHDLIHYAVETTLGFKQGFYGLVAGGMDIQDFDVPGADRKFDIPDEANYTEFIVALLQVEFLDGKPLTDFNAELQRSIQNARKPFSLPPPLTDEQLATIREKSADLIRQWSTLPPDGTLELSMVA
ncbi:MAG: hypothetical protein MI923_18955 [Phycisphaerales bacterium]|nr:hypothetical protein [Phycisphaerales bacterium]